MHDSNIEALLIQLVEQNAAILEQLELMNDRLDAITDQMFELTCELDWGVKVSSAAMILETLRQIETNTSGL